MSREYKNLDYRDIDKIIDMYAGMLNKYIGVELKNKKYEELNSIKKRIFDATFEPSDKPIFQDLADIEIISIPIMNAKPSPEKIAVIAKFNKFKAEALKIYNETISVIEDINKEKNKILGELNKAKELSKTADSKVNIEEFNNQLKDINQYTLETLILLGKSISGNIEAKVENVKIFIKLLSLYSFAKQKFDSIDNSIIERDIVLSPAKITIDRFFLEQNSMANDAQKLTDYTTRYDKEVDTAIKNIPAVLDMQTKYKELIRQSDQMKSMTAGMSTTERTKPEYADMFVLFSYADSNREAITRDNYIILEKMSERARNDYNTFIKNVSSGNRLEDFNKMSVSGKVAVIANGKAPAGADISTAVKDLPRWMQKEVIDYLNKKDPKEVINRAMEFEKELADSAKDGYLDKLKDMLYILNNQADKNEEVFGKKTVQNIIDEITSAINGTKDAREEVYKTYKNFEPLTVVEQYKYNAKDIPNAPAVSDITKGNVDAVRFMAQSVALKNELRNLDESYTKAKTDAERAKINQFIENKKKVYDNTVSTIKNRVKQATRLERTPAELEQAKMISEKSASEFAKQEPEAPTSLKTDMLRQVVSITKNNDNVLDTDELMNLGGYANNVDTVKFDETLRALHNKILQDIQVLLNDLKVKSQNETNLSIRTLIDSAIMEITKQGSQYNYNKAKSIHDDTIAKIESMAVETPAYKEAEKISDNAINVNARAKEMVDNLVARRAVAKNMVDVMDINTAITAIISAAREFKLDAMEILYSNVINKLEAKSVLPVATDLQVTPAIVSEVNNAQPVQE